MKMFRRLMVIYASDDRWGEKFGLISIRPNNFLVLGDFGLGPLALSVTLCMQHDATIGVVRFSNFTEPYSN